MASKFCIEELSEQLSLVDSHRGFDWGCLYFKLDVCSDCSSGKPTSFSRIVEILYDTCYCKKVVLESRCFRFCSRNFGPADVWCHHRGNVKKDIEWRPEYCLLLSDNFKPLLFLVGSSVQRIIFDDNSHCSWQASFYFTASTISRACDPETCDYRTDGLMADKWYDWLAFYYTLWT